MQLTAELAAFITGPVLMTLGSRDAANRPMVGRGTGGHVPPALDRVEIAICTRLWPETAANLRDNGMLAATFVRPADYRAYQLKGRARLRPPEPEDVARAAAYVARTARLLGDLGVPRPLIDYWLSGQDIVVAELVVDRIFEQTPGPRAGAVVA